MKKFIGRVGLVGLVGLFGVTAAVVAPVAFTGCVRLQTGTGTNGVPVYTTLLDTNAVITGINAVVPTAVRLACQKDTNAAPYFQQAVIVLKTANADGVVDPALIRSSLMKISIRELRTDSAVLAEEAGLQIYQTFAAQVVSTQMDRVAWLRPILSALANSMAAGLPPN